MALICLAGALAASAQTTTSTLAGTVTDESGLVLPGATITVTHVSTNAARSAVSSHEGTFRMAALTPGAYSLVVELPGFRSVSMSSINLQSSETRDVGLLALSVGVQTEAITVRADVTPMQLASAERSSSITGDQLQTIQLRGRDVLGFTSLVPGVLDVNNSRDYTTYSSMAGISINGAPSTYKNVIVDGHPMVDNGSSGSIFVNPNMDAVAEVKVLSNGFQAEFGRNIGGTISIITKSGGSELRGSGWYNGRRDRFNATPYLNTIQDQPKPEYDINIAGYSLGGQVPPRLVGGKVKAFFFASQEYTRDSSGRSASGSTPEGLPVVANLPTAAERLGDFSHTRATNGSILPIIDPLTGRPFPGNVIPGDRIDPTGQAMLGLLPMPNGYVNPQAGQEHTANSFFQQTPLHIRLDSVVRVDANFTENTTAFVRYMRDRDDFTTYNAVAPGVGSVTNFVPGWVMSGHVGQVLGPRMVNEITAGYGWKNYANRRPRGEEAAYYRSALGVDPPRLQPFAPTDGIPRAQGQLLDEWPYVPVMTFSGGNRANLPGFFGGTQFGPGGRALPSSSIYANAMIQDDLSVTAGRHNLKTGVFVEYSRKTETSGTGQNYMGNFNFGSNPTNPLDTGYGYANALLGVFQSYTESTRRMNKDTRTWLIEAYVQDNWRVSPRLTLDYGLRVSHIGPYHEVTGLNSGFYPDVYDPAQQARLYAPLCLSGAAGNAVCPASQRRAYDPVTGAVVPFGYAGALIPGSGDPSNGMVVDGQHGGGYFYDNPYLVFSPRLGFAWDVTGDGKTALRASTGIFYNKTSPSQTGYSFYNSPPHVYDKVISSATIAEIPSLAQNAVVNPATSVAVGGQSYELERGYQANIGFQRDLGFNTVVDIAYVGNFIRHTLRREDLNALPLYAFANPANLFNNTPINANLVRTSYPGYGQVLQNKLVDEGLNYNGMQVQLQRRLTGGLQFGGAYTLSKSTGVQGFDPYTQDLRARYDGPLPTDQRHNVSLNYSYMLPNPSSPLLEKLFGDWQVSGVTKFQTGTPLTPQCTSNNAGLDNIDPSYTGLGTNAITGVRCQMVGDPYSGVPSSDDPETAVLFNAGAFAMAQPISATEGNFGNTPIGIIRRPSWSNWDITLAKHMRLAGRVSARLQFQVYNVFNQKEFTSVGTTFNFTGPNNSVNTNTQTGRYITQNQPRMAALTVRMEF